MSNIYFILFGLLVPVFAKDCVFKYSSDFPDKEPVLLQSFGDGYDLIEPHNTAVVLKKNEPISLVCPGSRNNIVTVNSHLVDATCVGEQTLQIGNTLYLLSDLGCKTTVTGEFMLGEEICGDGGGIIKHIGHNIEGEFKTLLYVCYSDKIGGALYSEHTIYGSAVDFSGSSGGRPSFKVGGLAPEVSADSYKQTAQKSTFTNLLGSATLAGKYIFSNSYLARGHLTPDKDMVFVSSQSSTYFLINTVPQWQQINNGNWKSLEISLRGVAASLGQNFRVFTGSYDVLQLPDINNNLVEITLSNGKLPVPKFVWKVFFNEETNRAVAFISVNNPFEKKITEDMYLCPDICNQYGWGTESWSKPEKGLLYCCEVDALRQAVNHVPDLPVSGIQDNFVFDVKRVFLE